MINTGRPGMASVGAHDSDPSVTGM